MYFDYNIKKERTFRKGGALYIASPVALTWNDEKYYLIAHSDEVEGFKHFRVDKMASVKKLDDISSSVIKNFNIAEYTKKVFGMYGGEETNVKLRINNKLAGAVIDHFGKDIILTPDGKDHFIVTVGVAISPIFFGWLFQFGDLCQIISPKSLKDELRNTTEKFLKKLK